MLYSVYDLEKKLNQIKEENKPVVALIQPMGKYLPSINEENELKIDKKIKPNT